MAEELDAVDELAALAPFDKLAVKGDFRNILEFPLGNQATTSRYVNGEREPRALTVATLADVLGVKPSDIIGTSDEQEMDTAVSFIVRNIDKLTEAQRAELIAALSKF